MFVPLTPSLSSMSTTHRLDPKVDSRKIETTVTETIQTTHYLLSRYRVLVSGSPTRSDSVAEVKYLLLWFWSLTPVVGLQSFEYVTVLCPNLFSENYDLNHEKRRRDWLNPYCRSYVSGGVTCETTGPRRLVFLVPSPRIVDGCVVRTGTRPMNYWRDTKYHEKTFYL